jgi:Emfourin
VKRYSLIFWICLVVAPTVMVFGCAAQAVDSNPQNNKIDMHIQFKAEGGMAFIPGLSQEATLASANLSQQEIDKLQKLIDQSRFFELPAEFSTAPAGAADFRQYTVTIEEEGRRHTIQFTDLLDNPALKELFAYLETLHRKGK